MAVSRRHSLLVGNAIYYQLSRQQQMLSFLFSEDASFESWLEHFLSESADKLSESLLHNVMTTLRGEDPNVKSEIAFARFKKLITCFDPEQDQLKILKELLLLDKLVEENLFCAEISTVSFFAVESSRNVLADPWKENARRLLRLFWKIIRDKSIIMVQDHHIMQQKRSQRDAYLRKQSEGAILAQIGTIEAFFPCIFELAYYLENPNLEKIKEAQEWKKGGVVGYIRVHLLYKLLYLYNCQLLMHKHLCCRVSQFTQQGLVSLRRYVVRFRENCNRFILFLKEHKDARGFEGTNFEEIKVEVNEGIANFIDNYLHHLETQANEHPLHQLPFDLGKIKVEIRPEGIHRMGNVPRLKLNNKEGKEKGKEGNPFANWQNSYSHEFPQKEIMSVDLIMQIKLQESLSKHAEEQIVDDSRDNNVYLVSSCSFEGRSTCASSSYSLAFRIKEYQVNQLESRHFDNLYSRLPHKWNE